MIGAVVAHLTAIRADISPGLKPIRRARTRITPGMRSGTSARPASFVTTVRPTPPPVVTSSATPESLAPPGPIAKNSTSAWVRGAEGPRSADEENGRILAAARNCCLPELLAHASQSEDHCQHERAAGGPRESRTRATHRKGDREDAANIRPAPARLTVRLTAPCQVIVMSAFEIGNPAAVRAEPRSTSTRACASQRRIPVARDRATTAALTTRRECHLPTVTFRCEGGAPSELRQCGCSTSASTNCTLDDRYLGTRDQASAVAVYSVPTSVRCAYATDVSESGDVN